MTGIILVGIGALGTDVALRSKLYGLNPNIRMRLNSIYSTGTFVGGALFSFITPIIWNEWGWKALTAVAFAICIVWLGMTRSHTADTSAH